MKRKMWQFLVAAVLLLLSAAYLHSEFAWSEAFSVLKNANWVLFFLGTGVLFTLNVLARTLRWISLIRSPRQHIEGKALYLTTAVFVSLSMLTPGQLGEILKLKSYQRLTHQSVPQLLGTFVVERVLDLIVVCGMAAFGLLIIIPSDRFPGLLESAALCLVVLIGGLIIARKIHLPGRVGELLQDFRNAHSGGSGMFRAVILTLLAWLLVAISWKLTLYSIDVHIRLDDAIALTGLTTLSVVLSFIPGGLGVSEVVITELLKGMGSDVTGAQAGALIIRLMGMWWIVFGLSHSIFIWRSQTGAKTVDGID